METSKIRLYGHSFERRRYITTDVKEAFNFATYYAGNITTRPTQINGALQNVYEIWF